MDIIESQVKGLHDYVDDNVDDNKKWQNQQSNRQTDYETNINTMSTSMNDMGSKIDKLVGLFQTNSLDADGSNPPGKRPVDSLSPDHHANTDKQYPQKEKFNHSNHDKNKTQAYNNHYKAGMTTSPPSKLSQFPSQPNGSDDEMHSPKNRSDAAGEGQ